MTLYNIYFLQPGIMDSFYSIVHIIGCNIIRKLKYSSINAIFLYSMTSHAGVNVAYQLEVGFP